MKAPKTTRDEIAESANHMASRHGADVAYPYGTSWTVRRSSESAIDIRSTSTPCTKWSMKLQ